MISTILPRIQIDDTVVDFNDTARVLFQGETGSGKSCAILEIIKILTKKYTPKQLSIIYHDCKQVEWHDDYLAEYRKYYPAPYFNTEEYISKGDQSIEDGIRIMANTTQKSASNTKLITVVIIEEISDLICNAEMNMAIFLDLISAMHVNNKKVFLIATTSTDNDREDYTDFLRFVDSYFTRVVNFNTNKMTRKISMIGFDQGNGE